MKTDMQETCLLSDKSTNEQQVWVTVLSLQYSSFLLLSSRTNLRMSGRSGLPCRHCSVCSFLRFLLLGSSSCVPEAMWVMVSGQRLFLVAFHSFVTCIFLISAHETDYFLTLFIILFLPQVVFSKLV